MNPSDDLEEYPDESDEDSEVFDFDPFDEVLGG